MMTKIFESNITFIISCIFACGLFYGQIQSKIDDLNEKVDVNSQQISNLDSKFDQLEFRK